ncbi:MAG: glycosyl transferase family 1 [Flavobacteriales bacterium]|nr:glycosyl transferase family 1 [Flavobacteriales bacterium]MBG65477.1 glycosyl transferase family 1 [Flavobacteriales bacterium]|tara:strand:- start:93 stop:1391 length:1299 start_codon:yes stop_codon:yes gene_type:complete
MNKVLVISYYWPPMGGGGVQRWLKTIKYLRQYKWEPIVFTVNNSDISLYDDSLLYDVPDGIEVISSNIWEPFSLYRIFTGKKDEKINPGFLSKKKGVSFLNNLSIWIRGNFFIPDAKMFWYNPAIKTISRYLQNNKVDAIVSTGPPHTTHLIALFIKKKFDIPWLADFRDPWTNIDFYDKLKLTKWADKRHRRLEMNVLLNANKLVTVSESWAKDFLNICGIKPDVITNGYDPADFNKAGKVKLDKKFTLVHIGSLNKDRNPFNFWKALKDVIIQMPEILSDLEIQLIGPIDISVKDELEKYKLLDITKLVDSLPHKKVIKQLIKSQVLLLFLNNVSNINGVIPGKMYEYIGAKRPILCIGKKSGDASTIIKKTKSGVVVDFNDIKSMKKEIITAYTKFKNKTLQVDEKNHNDYSRKKLAGDFSLLLNELIS